MQADAENGDRWDDVVGGDAPHRSSPPITDLSQVDWAYAIEKIPIRAALFHGNNEVERFLPDPPGQIASVEAKAAPGPAPPPSDAETVEKPAAAPPAAAPPHTTRSKRPALIVLMSIAVAVLVGLFALSPGGDGDSSSLTDDFNRTDNASSLGQTQSGHTWQEVQSTWGIEHNTARLVRTEGPTRGVAFVDPGSVNGTVSVTLPVTRLGAGIVFRYQDFSHYWSVEAAPQFGTWVIRKFVDFRATVTTNTGATAPDDGTKLTVSLDGQQIQVFVDGVLRRTLNDSDFDNATGVGLTASGPQRTEARWSDFTYSPEPKPAPTRAK